MNRKILIVAAAFAAVVVLLGTQAVMATVIDIPVLNASFESPGDPTVPVNTETLAVPTNWTPVQSGATYLVNGTAITGAWGAAAPDGAQALEVTINESQGVWQNTGVELQNGWTYTIGFQSNAYAADGGCRADLLAADNTSDEGTSFLAAGATTWDAAAQTVQGWGSFSTSGTYTGASGKYLSVMVAAAGNWQLFDNVTVTATSPEPSTLVLLSVGLVSLLAYAWRKRK